MLDACNTYERDLLNHSACWTKDRMRQVSAVRQLARWYGHAYGTAMQLADLAPNALLRYREHCLKLSSAKAFQRRRGRLRLFGRWLQGSGRADANPFDCLDAS